MRLNITLLLLTMISQPAMAEQIWQCYTDPLTTTFISEIADDKMHLTLMHHHGVKYMPIHNGIITPSDIEFIKTKVDLIQKLGDRLTLTFLKKNCKIYGEWIFSCWSNEPIEKNGITIESLSFISSTISQNIFDYVFQEVEFRLSLRINKKSYTIPMTFMANQCHK